MKKTTLLLALILIASISQAQMAQNNSHPSVNYERLKRIDNLVNDFIAQKRIAGAVTMVVKDGQIIQHKGYGYDDIEAKTPLSTNGIFRIASQTKAITSVGVMLLYEEGKLLLNEPVSKYLSGFTKPQVVGQYNEKDTTYTTVPAKREITIKDLLTHTSGVGYAGIGSPMMRAIYAKNKISAGLDETGVSLQEKMNELGKLPLEFQPGERWSYSLGDDILGAVIEKISGQSLEVFFKKRIFEPLGMNDTYFNLPADKHARLTTMYIEDSTKAVVKMKYNGTGLSPDFPKRNKAYFSGGGGLSSTSTDYAIFLQMLLNKGTYKGVDLLSPATVELMLRNQIGDLPFGRNKFSLGFEIVTDKAADDIRSVGTFSWGGAFATSYWADPKQKMIILLMTQQFPSSHYEELKSKLLVAVYQSLKLPVANGE